MCDFIGWLMTYSIVGLFYLIIALPFTCTLAFGLGFACKLFLKGYHYQFLENTDK